LSPGRWVAEGSRERDEKGELAESRKQAAAPTRRGESVWQTP